MRKNEALAKISEFTVLGDRTLVAILTVWIQCSPSLLIKYHQSLQEKKLQIEDLT